MAYQYCKGFLLTTKFYKIANDTSYLAPKKRKPKGKADIHTEGTAIKKKEKTTTKQIATQKFTLTSSMQSSDIPEKTGFMRPQITYNALLMGR